MKWEPIETGPRDGTIVVLFCPGGIKRQGYGTADPPYTIGHYAMQEHGGPPKWLSVETIMEYHDYGGMTGVSTWTEQIEVNPTHWTPLLEAPTARE